MKRLLLAFLIPLLSGTFVLSSTYEAKIDELEHRIEILENQDITLNETFTKSSEHYEVTIVIEDGYIKSITVLNLTTNKSDTEYPDYGEQEIFTNEDRDYIIQELNNYLEALEYMWDLMEDV